jgi:Aspartyl protease
VVLLLTITLAFNLSPQSPKSIEIPLRRSRDFGLLSVNARVNGMPAVFTLDTRSNHTIVSSKLVDVATPSLKDWVTTKRGSGYSGRGIFTRASLAVGPVLWRDHRILAMDTNELSQSMGESVDGILGMDFLNEFDIVIVDLRQQIDSHALAEVIPREEVMVGGV